MDDRSYDLDSDSDFDCDDDRDLDFKPSFELSDFEYSRTDNDDGDQTLRQNGDESSNTCPDPDIASKRNGKQTEIDFSTDFSLAPIVKTKCNTDVELWKRFGVLMKAGKVVKGLSGRIYCTMCFDNKVLKRYSLRVTLFIFICVFRFEIRNCI